MEIFDESKKYGLTIQEICKKGDAYLNAYLDCRKADFDRTFTWTKIHTYFPNQVVLAEVLPMDGSVGYNAYSPHKILYYRCNSNSKTDELYHALMKEYKCIAYVQCWDDLFTMGLDYTVD